MNLGGNQMIVFPMIMLVSRITNGKNNMERNLQCFNTIAHDYLKEKHCKHGGGWLQHLI